MLFQLQIWEASSPFYRCCSWPSLSDSEAESALLSVETYQEVTCLSQNLAAAESGTLEFKKTLEPDPENAQFGSFLFQQLSPRYMEKGLRVALIPRCNFLWTPGGRWVLWGVKGAKGSVQFCSVAQSCPTLCNPMDLPVHHQLPESTQTRLLGDAIQTSHPLLSPSPPAFNLSQHQGLFQWVSSSHQVAKVLEFQLQHQSFL